MKRRMLLQGALATIAAAHAAHAEDDMVKWSTGTEKPRLQMPPGATDCHHHIYDFSRFPADPKATVVPGDATVEDYRALKHRLGITRHVVVQPSTYGTDNRCLLDALATFGADARGVAVVDTSVTDDELHRLHQAGVRAIRFNLVQAAATTTSMLDPLAHRVHELGWHIEFNIAGDLVTELAPQLGKLPCPIVLDHLAHIPEPAGTAHPAFAVVRDLLQNGRTWTTISGEYLDTKVGPPGYSDIGKVAQGFVQAAPERIVWGSDWPHPTAKGAKPDDAVLLDLLLAWVPDEAQRRRILVDNAAELYDFPAA
jgi:D-galactarolactone isomerase